MKKICIYLILCTLLQFCISPKNSLNSYEKTLNDLLSVDSLSYDICAQIQKESKKLFFKKDLSENLLTNIKNFSQKNKILSDAKSFTTSHGGNSCILVESVLHSLIASSKYSIYTDSLRIEILLLELNNKDLISKNDELENLLKQALCYASNNHRYEIFARHKNDTINGVFIVKNLIRSCTSDKDRVDMIHVILDQLRSSTNSFYYRILRSFIDYCNETDEIINKKCSEGIKILKEELIKLKELEIENSNPTLITLQISIDKIEVLLDIYDKR